MGLKLREANTFSLAAVTRVALAAVAAGDLTAVIAAAGVLVRGEAPGTNVTLGGCAEPRVGLTGPGDLVGTNAAARGGVGDDAGVAAQLARATNNSLLFVHWASGTAGRAKRDALS